jgi:aerobic-type carbon monoxide dehydrogenase small subunit (CoxS/CutS family)
MIAFTVNNKERQVDVSPDTPLLWVLREKLGLIGTKFGCGEGLCGACTVHIDGKPQRACITPVGDVQGKKVVTIEGIAENHPVKKAWLAEEVSQCGYCQPGQIMSAVALLKSQPQATDADIDSAMSGNLCRCGTYGRIRRAIHVAGGKTAAKGGKSS